MLIIWVRKNRAEEQSRPQTIKDKESVKKHNEDMKKFRIAHPEINTEKPEEAVTAENCLLLPVQGVKLPKNSQN